MENPTSNPRPLAAQLLIALQLILGIGAVFGGLGLAIDPSGELMHMPIEFLEPSPFTTFLVPGIVLLLLLGLLPLWVTVGLIQKQAFKPAEMLNVWRGKHWSWGFSLYIGFLLIGWITLQVYFIQRVGIVHVGYILGALLLLAITLLPSVQKYYSADT